MIKEREVIKEVKRVVIKVGTSTIAHTGGLINIYRMEHLARMISDLKNRGYQVVLVSSGAIAAGRQALGGQKRPDTISEKQAYAAVGQARLMMVYQKLFSEYNCVAAQVL